MEKTIEIPFGAKDSELKGWEYTIPENMEAEIKDGKIIVREKENEDEKIRKQIIGFFSGRYALCNINTKEAIAYLEKQKEQKWSPSEREMGALYNLCYISNQITDENDVELTRLYQDLKREYFNGRSFENMFLDEKQKEQKPAEWSEENEERLDSIIESYKELLKDYKACHDIDYIPYNSNTVIRNVVDDVNFLKSLRPHHSWKPSEVQMEALSDAYAEARTFKMADILESLHQDLEKLQLMRQTFYAVHDYEIIPCHLIAKKDRYDGRKYAANSKRDKRRFQNAYSNREDAENAVAKYEIYMNQPDTFQP